jgi:RNA polymerase sigma factor (sigma-70 family)
VNNNTQERFLRDIMLQLDAAQSFARFLSRDADVAKDIVQEAFLQACRGFQGYQGGDPRAWIFAIVRNCHRSWLKQRRRKMRLEVESVGSSSPDVDPVENVASDADTPEMTLLRRAESMAVQLVLNKMPRPMREVLVLRELEGLSYREIADATALPIGTVMSRLARARAHFQAAWRQQLEK